MVHKNKCTDSEGSRAAIRQIIKAELGCQVKFARGKRCTSRLNKQRPWGFGPNTMHVIPRPSGAAKNIAKKILCDEIVEDTALGYHKTRWRYEGYVRKVRVELDAHDRNSSAHSEVERLDTRQCHRGETTYEQKSQDRKHTKERGKDMTCRVGQAMKRKKPKKSYRSTSCPHGGRL